MLIRLRENSDVPMAVPCLAEKFLGHANGGQLFCSD